MINELERDIVKALEDFTPIVSDVYYKYVKRQLGIK